MGEARRVAVQTKLAAQVEAEGVAKVVRDDVILGQLLEGEVERQIADEDVRIGVRPTVSCRALSGHVTHRCRLE